MVSELESIHVAIASRPNQHYRPELRSRIAIYAQKRRHDGDTKQSIVDALGIQWSTINRWLEQQQPPTSLVQVRVRESIRKPDMTLSLVSPGGYRLEGLAASDAVAVFRSLQ